MHSVKKFIAVQGGYTNVCTTRLMSYDILRSFVFVCILYFFVSYYIVVVSL